MLVQNGSVSKGKGRRARLRKWSDARPIELKVKSIPVKEETHLEETHLPKMALSLEERVAPKTDSQKQKPSRKQKKENPMQEKQQGYSAKRYETTKEGVVYLSTTKVPGEEEKKAEQISFVDGAEQSPASDAQKSAVYSPANSEQLPSVYAQVQSAAAPASLQPAAYAAQEEIKTVQSPYESSASANLSSPVKSVDAKPYQSSLQDKVQEAALKDSYIQSVQELKSAESPAQHSSSLEQTMGSSEMPQADAWKVYMAMATSMLQGYQSGTLSSAERAEVDLIKSEIGYLGPCCDERLKMNLAEKLADKVQYDS